MDFEQAYSATSTALSGKIDRASAEQMVSEALIGMWNSRGVADIDRMSEELANRMGERSARIRVTSLAQALGSLDKHS